MASLCGGVFDVTVAPTLVARGILPRPNHAPDPDELATWRDIVLLPDLQVCFRRPLWIDLGGIAKGYAVDRAIDAAMAYAPAQVCANAGGDLRIAGPETENVRLADEICDPDAVPVIELTSGSLASSCGRIASRHEPLAGPYVDARDGRHMLPRQFVSVAAPRCVGADALTKVVMALGACSASILAASSAQAIVHDAQFGWRTIREDA
ncbi:MAG: FAD:protein FMN transferase [Alphaproteobacteria bacterium]|nr:FAD:protein FMN transferase [Alphaproteobacteria bacterium]MDE2494274.1 FAD:protein FMN transferase [Alphaproteobacteria bacterium]